MKKSWIIARQGTVGGYPDGKTKGLRMKHAPQYVHFDRESAITELARLAKKFPGDDFMLYESIIQATGHVEVEIREPTEPPEKNN